MSKFRLFMFEHVYTSLLIFLLLLSAVFIALSFLFKTGSIPSNIFINLSASSVFGLITVFGIEYLRESKRKIEIQDGEKAAAFDAARISRMLVWWLGGPMGENSLDYKIDPKNKSKSEDENARICVNKLKAINLYKKVEELPPTQWKNLITNLNLLKEQIDEFSKYYADVTPHRVYSAYLVARRNHAAVLRSLAPGPFTDILTKAQKDWPSNKFGQQYNLEIRKELIKQLVPLLADYLESIERFHESVVSWTSKAKVKYE